jgi:DNA polymerase-1
VTAAFGLRVRTPILRQVVLGNRATPWEASSESRTAGNALGQSWCLLNSRAGSEFMSVVRSSKYQHLIQICAQIHDASYYLIPDNMEILQFVNEHLVKAVNWQDHPDIWHVEVKLGGELSVFYPSWAEELTIPNQASSDDIKVLAADHYNKYCGG